MNRLTQILLVLISVSCAPVPMEVIKIDQDQGSDSGYTFPVLALHNIKVVPTADPETISPLLEIESKEICGETFPEAIITESGGTERFQLQSCIDDECEKPVEFSSNIQPIPVSKSGFQTLQIKSCVVENGSKKCNEQWEGPVEFDHPGYDNLEVPKALQDMLAARSLLAKHCGDQLALYHMYYERAQREPKMTEDMLVEMETISQLSPDQCAAYYLGLFSPPKGDDDLNLFGGSLSSLGIDDCDEAHDLYNNGQTSVKNAAEDFIENNQCGMQQGMLTGSTEGKVVAGTALVLGGIAAVAGFGYYVYKQQQNSLKNTPDVDTPKAALDGATLDSSSTDGTSRTKTPTDATPDSSNPKPTAGAKADAIKPADPTTSSKGAAVANTPKPNAPKAELSVPNSTPMTPPPAMNSTKVNAVRAVEPTISPEDASKAISSRTGGAGGLDANQMRIAKAKKALTFEREALELIDQRAVELQSDIAKLEGGAPKAGMLDWKPSDLPHLKSELLFHNRLGSDVRKKIGGLEKNLATLEAQANPNAKVPDASPKIPPPPPLGPGKAMIPAALPKDGPPLPSSRVASGVAGGKNSSPPLIPRAGASSLNSKTPTPSAGGVKVLPKATVISPPRISTGAIGGVPKGPSFKPSSVFLSSTVEDFEDFASQSVEIFASINNAVAQYKAARAKLKNCDF